MLAIPTDPRAARAMLEQQTAELEEANVRLRPRTSRLSPEDVERMRVEASQVMPMPMPEAPKRKPQSLARRLFAVAYAAFLAGGSEAAK